MNFTSIIHNNRELARWWTRNHGLRDVGSYPTVEENLFIFCHFRLFHAPSSSNGPI